MASKKTYWIYNIRDELVYEGTNAECMEFLSCGFGTFRRLVDTCEYYHGYLVTRKDDMIEYEAYRKRKETEKMNNNDIIKMLQSYVCHTSSDYDHKQEVIKMAKVLVERDEAKKAKVHPFGMFESWDCPSCKNMVFKKQRFCEICGQRLDWRGEEE